MIVKRILSLIIPDKIKIEIKYFLNFNNVRDIYNFIAKREEFQIEAEGVKKYGLYFFPYKFIEKYDYKNIVINKDENHREYYLYRDKRMYFKRSMNLKDIKKYINSILLEQDVDSPHYYHTEKLLLNDAIRCAADIGAAEGFWGLDIIDKVDKLYIFECDKEWVEALSLTFAPYQEKVEIVEKFVGSTDTDDRTSLDTYFKNRKLDILKADIEGAEMAMCNGGVNTFSNLTTAVVCTYHRHKDAENIQNFLVDKGFKTEFTKGYMIWNDYHDMQEPYLRKAVIIGQK